MDDVHCLRQYGGYGFSDILEMSPGEQEALLSRRLKQMKDEARRLKRK
jgi:hypothetical protein